MKPVCRTSAVNILVSPTNLAEGYKRLLENFFQSLIQIFFSKLYVSFYLCDVIFAIIAQKFFKKNLHFFYCSATVKGAQNCKWSSIENKYQQTLKDV